MCCIVTCCLSTETKGPRHSVAVSIVTCGLYSAPPHLCSALLSIAPEWKFSPSDVTLRILHNGSAIPLAQQRSAVMGSSIAVLFRPIIMSLVPSIVELRHVTSEIRVDGLGFAACAQDAEGWSLWLQAASQEALPSMMESSCRVLSAETLLCTMPDWGAAYPAAMITVNVLDCSNQDVQQILPREFSLNLLPSVLSIFPTTSSFKDAVPVTITGRGFSSELGLKVIFYGEFGMRAADVTVVNHTMIVAATPNWGSLAPQQLANVSVSTDSNELLGGYLQPPIFLFTHSIRRVFPLVHSAAGGSTATVYGLGFAPGTAYTCIFVASSDSNQVMSHSLGIAPGYTVIRCKLPSWGHVFRAGRVLLRVLAPAQSLPIPADTGAIELNIQPFIHNVFPVVIQFSRNAVAVVNGSGFGKNMSITMRLRSESDSLASATACIIANVTTMMCPVPTWSVLYPARAVQVLFDIEAPDVSATIVRPDTQITFLESVQSVQPTSGPIQGGTLMLFVCEGLSTQTRIIVKFAHASGVELTSIPVFATNSSSLMVASPNWLFSQPSSTSFTTVVSVSLCAHSVALILED
jgi:hypothetical protein